jgi:hypothetical protein
LSKQLEHQGFCDVLAEKCLCHQLIANHYRLILKTSWSFRQKNLKLEVFCQALISLYRSSMAEQDTKFLQSIYKNDKGKSVV